MKYSIFITNIKNNKLSDTQAILLYKSRWQIELLFKLYKSEIMITKLKGKTKSSRIICELYSKLIIIAMLHGLVNCASILKTKSRKLA